jgi:diadenosine tetraphosphate (Ap4A) HIT family hydrolase
MDLGLSPNLSGPLDLPAFGDIEPARILALGNLFAVIADKFPISPGHALIIARRPIARFSELTPAEKARLLDLIDWTQKHLTESLNPPPDAFNLGLNDGPAAGQTIPQFHFHVIPRYAGDVPDPRGGIRWTIPAKASYWSGLASALFITPCISWLIWRNC